MRAAAAARSSGVRAGAYIYVDALVDEGVDMPEKLPAGKKSGEVRRRPESWVIKLHVAITAAADVFAGLLIAPWLE